LKCSTLGALVSILSHVIERRSGECLAGIGTLAAMFICYLVTLLVVGPVLVLMVAAHCLELRSAAQLDLAQARQRRVHLAWYVFAAVTFLMFMLALATGAKSSGSGTGGASAEMTSD
jgi:hypothetical protein